MEMAIELKGVSKEYPGILALNNINLKVKKGSIHGFLGPNGAGKSTTMKIISGLIPASSGQVYINNELVKDKGSFAGQIGLLPENPPLYDNMKVDDYLKFCLNINSDSKDLSNIKNVIDRCRLKDVSSRLIGNLSKGYRQRVGIAQALVADAKIIILDEPTIGLDPNAITDVRSLIKELGGEHTILLSTHQLHEVGRVCDEITIINKGEVLKSGELSGVQSEFSRHKTFVARSKSIDDEKLAAIRKMTGVSALVHAHEDHGEVNLEIKVQSEFDLRSELIKELSQIVELLEFSQVKMELEDIFKEIVK